MIRSLSAKLSQIKIDAAIALVIAEDDVGLFETVAHLNSIGFAHIAAVSTDAALLARLVKRHDSVIAASADVLPRVPDLLNALMPKLAGRWVHVCYNGEFLFFPFCQHRSILDAISFSADERRESVFGYTIDLYQDDFALSGPVSPGSLAYFDDAGYYGVTASQTADQAPLVEVFGGLRWRFSEHVPLQRRKINRTCLFKAAKDLRLDAEMVFNVPDYNSVSCKWHHNMTMAVGSFRAAKALHLNPSSNSAITTLKWPLSRRFEWTSEQLMQLGFIEPGQWF